MRYASLSLPNPLARLTLILESLDRARAGRGPVACDDHDARIAVDKPPVENNGDHGHNMSTLSLTVGEPPVERRREDLEFFSLSCVEKRPSTHDGLGDLGLTRGFPPRPGA